MLHNDVPGVREIEVLASVQGRTCVTIVTPTEDKARHPDAPLTTFRNQAKAVLERITDETQRRVFADRFVEFTDPGFWRHQCRSEEHTSELQSRGQLVCRLLLEKKNAASV